METVRSSSIGAAFDEIAGRYPDKEALICEDQRITYRQLKERSAQVARGLMALGVEKGEKVSVWMNNNPEWVYAYLGSAKAGSIFVSVNARFKTHELEYVLRQSDSRAVLFQDRLHTTNYMEIFREVCPEVSSSVSGNLISQKFPLLKHVVCVTPQEETGTLSFSRLLQFGEKNISLAEREERQNSVQPEDLIMIQYTSGTTSFPKGCMTTHGQVFLDALAIGKNMAIDFTDRLYCPLPFSHAGGCIITLMKGLLRGATIVTTRHFDPEEALKVIEREKCTCMNGVETIWLEMLKHPCFDSYNLHTLKKGWTTGPAELRQSIYEKMGVKRFVSTYGLSEATANTGTTLADDPLELKLAWNGRPHPGSEMKIIDRKTGRTLPPGQEGEICVRGFNVMKGYYRMPEETSKVIDPEGWLHTGDLGVMNEAGYFKFSGRVKDMLRVGGENVAALEVEGFFMQHPAVKQVQVIGVPDPKLVEVPMAVVQLKEGHGRGCHRLRQRKTLHL